MKNPKILIIGTTDRKGGAAAVSWNLAEGLREKGYWVKHLVGYKYSDSIHVDQLNTPLGRDASLYLRHLRSYLLANDQDFGPDKQIFNHPWYQQADIVHLHNTHGNYISLAAIEKISQEKKLVWTLHDMWPITSHCAYTKRAHESTHDPLDCSLGSYPAMLWGNGRRLWSKKLEYLSGPNITFISSSKWLMKKFNSTSLRSKRVTQIYNGIDTNIFRNENKNNVRGKLGLSSEGRIALYVAANGKSSKRKGFLYLEHLAEMNQDTIFIVIGGRKNYQQNNIRYISKTSSKKELADYYNAADTFIFPSLADNNPQVVLEALSCHLPILGFRATGTTELVNHKKNGYLAVFNDKKGLQRGLEYLFGHSFTPSNFSADYSVEKMVRSHKKLYQELLR